MCWLISFSLYKILFLIGYNDSRFNNYLSTCRIIVSQTNMKIKIVPGLCKKCLKAFSCEWKSLERCTVRVDFVKGGKRTQSALKCELWSQAAVKETLWSRKMMHFPAKWLRVTGRTLKYLLLRVHKPQLESKMVTAQVFGAAHQPLSVNILCCDQILYYILTVYSMDTLNEV